MATRPSRSTASGGAVVGWRGGVPPHRRAGRRRGGRVKGRGHGAGYGRGGHDGTGFCARPRAGPSALDVDVDEARGLVAVGDARRPQRRPQSPVTSGCCPPCRGRRRGRTPCGPTRRRSTASGSGPGGRCRDARPGISAYGLCGGTPASVSVKFTNVNRGSGPVGGPPSRAPSHTSSACTRPVVDLRGDGVGLLRPHEARWRRAGPRASAGGPAGRRCAAPRRSSRRRHVAGLVDRHGADPEGGGSAASRPPATATASTTARVSGELVMICRPDRSYQALWRTRGGRVGPGEIVVWL